jgi:hypothetical protein
MTMSMVLPFDESPTSAPAGPPPATDPVSRGFLVALRPVVNPADNLRISPRSRWRSRSVARSPAPLVAPYHPRLDWRMRFSALRLRYAEGWITQQCMR